MNNIKLHIFDKTGVNLVKIYEAKPYELNFGTIRTLMEVLKIETMDNQMELLGTLAKAWDEIVSVLSCVFPECTEEEWNTVKAKEVLSVIIQIAKYAISEAFTIPTEKN